MSDSGIEPDHEANETPVQPLHLSDTFFIIL